MLERGGHSTSLSSKLQPSLYLEEAIIRTSSKTPPELGDHHMRTGVPLCSLVVRPEGCRRLAILMLTSSQPDKRQLVGSTKRRSGFARILDIGNANPAEAEVFNGGPWGALGGPHWPASPQERPGSPCGAEVRARPCGHCRRFSTTASVTPSMIPVPGAVAEALGPQVVR